MTMNVGVWLNKILIKSATGLGNIEHRYKDGYISQWFENRYKDECVTLRLLTKRR